MSFCDNLKELLKERNITQTKLANGIGFSQRAVSKWINSQAEPTETAIVACAKFFDISVDELLGLHDLPLTKDLPLPSSLPQDEIRLLLNYRSVPPLQKARIIAYTDFIREQESASDNAPKRK